MTSRTKSHSESPTLDGGTDTPLSALEKRRQEAVQRYVDGEPIAQICQEMHCAKSWLYKWKNRYQITEPDWATAHSRRPETTPRKTPEAIETHIVRLSQTLSTAEVGSVSAQMIHDHLSQHGGASIPSMRTIARILNRHGKEVSAHSVTS
jgi:transposase